jgi:hypothetical protein
MESEELHLAITSIKPSNMDVSSVPVLMLMFARYVAEITRSCRALSAISALSSQRLVPAAPLIYAAIATGVSCSMSGTPLEILFVPGFPFEYELATILSRIACSGMRLGAVKQVEVLQAARINTRVCIVNR